MARPFSVAPDAAVTPPTGCGIVFQVNKSGTERVLYRFKGGADGAHPQAGLIAENGMLYGTTGFGGTGCTSSGGCGTVFKVSTSGTERVLYSFNGGSDGLEPMAAVLAVNGTLYGTTAFGGTGCVSSGGCGTVFKVNKSGTERVLHRFKGGTDGATPRGALVALNGAFYSTTTTGGNGIPNCGGNPGTGCGTIFKVSLSGAESVLYRFTNGADGSAPLAGLADIDGSLYGTTNSGGTNCAGCGIVYVVTP